MRNIFATAERLPIQAPDRVDQIRRHLAAAKPASLAAAERRLKLARDARAEISERHRAAIRLAGEQGRNDAVTIAGIRSIDDEIAVADTNVGNLRKQLATERERLAPTVAKTVQTFRAQIGEDLAQAAILLAGALEALGEIERFEAGFGNMFSRTSDRLPNPLSIAQLAEELQR